MKRPWSEFTGIESHSAVHAPRHVDPNELCDMETWRKDERIRACGGHDPIRITLAYAQDELRYEDGEPINRFGLSYRRDAKFYLHKILADITVAAATYLYQTEGWTTVLYDGLRTVEGAYNLYVHASEDAMSSGLLSLPGTSAHNKGLAVDSMMVDSAGKEIEMGGHFDHPDMETNSRLYAGPNISEAAQMHRLIREVAFLRAALTQGLLIAPLRPEFWDDRLPENREDLWRVLDSAARCMGLNLLTPEDEALRKTDRAAFKAKWENWNYGEFLWQWKKTFEGREKELQQVLGVTAPPVEERFEFYHGNYHPIYDSTLKASGKNLT